MKQLHLLVPALFPPQEIAAEVCAGLQLPALEKLLAHGSASSTPAETLENWLSTRFDARAIAPVRASADGLDAEDGYWLCADPVNLQLQRAQMMLIPEVALNKDEAAALCDSLNAHFAESGLHFFAPHPRRWYVRLETEPHLSTTALGQAAWRDAKFHQPQGEDALRWQRITTEVQMLLYAHPLNQAREARGELTVGSLWWWGGGRAETLQQPFDAVGGNSVLGAAFAQVAGVPRVATWQKMLEKDGERGLWVSEALCDAQQRGDYFAWRQALQQLEQDCVLLLSALRSGRLRHLTLEVLQESGVQYFELSPASIWKLWRPARSLAYYAV